MTRQCVGSPFAEEVCDIMPGQLTEDETFPYCPMHCPHDDIHRVENEVDGTLWDECPCGYTAPAV